MGAPRLIHVIRQIGALVVAAVTAAATINAYRPLARNGFASLWSWFIGLVVTEFPLPTLASQLGGLVLTAQRLTRPVRAVSWLVAAFSALGLLNLSRAGRQADAQLTAALDSGLGPDRRTASAGLWRRPAGGGTAKTPGRCACCGSTAITHTMATSATANTAGPTTSISGDVPI